MKLKECNLDWRQFWEEAADGMALVDAAGIIQAVNPCFEHLSNYHAKQLYGLKLRCVLDGFSWPSFLEAKKAWSDERAQLRARGGQRLPVMASLTPLWEQGKLNAAVLMVRDHSHCQQRRQHLEILSAAVEQSPNAVMIVDLKGRIIYVNPNFVRLTGYPAEEVIGKDPGFLKSGRTPPETYRRLWETLRKEGEWRAEIQDRRKDGSLYWAFETISPIRDAQGKVTHYLAIQKDITEQKKAEEALRESEARFRQVADMTGEWIWEQDPQGRYIYSSTAVRKILGYQPEEILGRHYLELFTPEDRQHWEAQAPPTPTYQRRFSHVVNRYRHKDGHQIYTESTGLPIFDKQGRLLKWRGVDHDITERHRAEAERHALNIARHIQQSLLPAGPLQSSGLEVAGLCVPAQQVGGDYFDYFPTARGVDTVVADVSGHSVGAALIMSEARSILKVEVCGTQPPGVAELLTVLNDVLYDDLDRAEMFITLFYARYEACSGHLRYANAGHNRPLLLRHGETACSQLDAEGLILGVQKKVSFEEKRVALKPGDRLLLYTDGIVEAQNPAGEFYGLNRLCEVFIRLSGEPPKRVAEKLLQDVSAFRSAAEFDDDISLVVFQVGDPADGGRPQMDSPGCFPPSPG